jgi:DNA-binding NarL/FixJ family response regulator
MSYVVIGCSDEPFVLAGLRAELNTSLQFDLVASCLGRAEALKAAEKHQPDLILQCLALDPDLGFVRDLLRVSPKSSIVLWSRDFAADLVREAIEAGVRGFLSTTASPQELADCLLVSAGGELWMERALSMVLLNARAISLSNRQRQLIELLVQGLKNKEIAYRLGISEGTVKAYLTTLFEKVGAKDRFELALYGLKNLRNVKGGKERDLRKTGAVSLHETQRFTRIRTVA